MAKILIIDDDPVTSDLATQVLSDAGHEIRTAADGRIGLDIFRVFQPKLVITDILMPEREGLEIIISLRQLSPGLPIVAISGSPRYLDYARKLSADEIMAKPLDLLQLVDVVGRLLSR